MGNAGRVPRHVLVGDQDRARTRTCLVVGLRNPALASENRRFRFVAAVAMTSVIPLRPSAGSKQKSTPAIRPTRSLWVREEGSRLVNSPCSR